MIPVGSDASATGILGIRQGGGDGTRCEVSVHGTAEIRNQEESGRPRKARHPSFNVTGSSEAFVRRKSSARTSLLIISTERRGAAGAFSGTS